MNTYTIAINSRDRISGDPTNYKIRFGHVLPNDKRVFKCKVSSFVIDNTYDPDADPPEPPETMIDEAGVGITLVQVMADFPFINYYSTNTRPIALTSVRTWELVGPFEFLMGNINHQEINIKYMSVRNTQASFVEYENNGIIIITAEAIE